MAIPILGAVQLIGLDPSGNPISVRVNSDGTISGVSGSLPASLGQKAMAASLPVVLASDQTTLPVTLATTLGSDKDSISTEGSFATYAAAGQITVATSATNVLALVGSASKVVKVRKLGLIATATAAGNQLIAIYKQSADDTGGTFTTPTKVPFDSNSTAVTATLRQYSANPTVGAQIGAFGGAKIVANPVGTPTLAADHYIENYGINNDQPPTLRGIAEVFAVHCTGTILSGLVLNYLIEWTEQ